MTNLTSCEAVNAILHLLAETKPEQRKEILQAIAATYIAERILNGAQNESVLEELKERSDEILSALHSGRGKVVDVEGIAA